MMTKYLYCMRELHGNRTTRKLSLVVWVLTQRVRMRDYQMVQALCNYFIVTFIAHLFIAVTEGNTCIEIGIRLCLNRRKGG